MQNQNKSGFPNHQVFFWDAILDIYRAENMLFGFRYYRNRGFWEVFNGEPLYLSPETALRKAKLYCIESIVKLDLVNLTFAIDFSNDTIVYQSRSVKRILGKIEGCVGHELYINQRDRADIREKLQREGKVQAQVYLQNLDGKPIKGLLEAELIQVDSSTWVSIEVINLSETSERVSS